jgi:hypothetical protein
MHAVVKLFSYICTVISHKYCHHSNVLRYARANTDYSAAATTFLCDAIQMQDVKQQGLITYYTRYCSIGLLSLNDNSSSSRVVSVDSICDVI